jgi:regulator of ribonuclease activity A
VHEDIALMRDVVGQPGAGQVLVIDGGGSLRRALFGDVMAAVAAGNGWAGLVIHGAIRDGVEIDTMDIGVKALGTVPKRGERSGAGEADVPVRFGGVTFHPGRRLVADEDGVIVLPEGVHEDAIRTDDVIAATAAYAAAAGR